MQLASVVVSLLLTSAMINTPPSATPNYIHPQNLMPPGTKYWGLKKIIMAIYFSAFIERTCFTVLYVVILFLTFADVIDEN